MLHNETRSPVVVVVFLFVLVALAVQPVAADTATPEQFLQVLFGSEKLDHAKLFDAQFLAAVPPAKIDEIRDLYIKNLGQWQSVASQGSGLQMVFARGTAPCKIHFDDKGRVDGLWFGAWALTGDTLAQVLEAFKAMPGSGAMTLTRNGSETICDINGDMPLAVGSSFKLSIIQALLEAQKAGRYAPEAAVRLRPEWYSLPSGMLHEWPASTPVTVQTLANLMVSISDNTATDHLLFLLGRDAIEAKAPARVRPFMSTMEMFRVKYGDSARAQKFAAADATERRKMLETMVGETIDLERVREKPFLVDSVEWFYTTRELTALVYELGDNPALSINPGLVEKSKWHRVAFKGGSEPGVLNYTILLQKQPGSATYCLSLTANDVAKSIDKATMNGVAGRVIGLIASGSFDVGGK